MLLPIMKLNVGVLHRWAPFRLPQFFAGISAGLLAQRGDITNATLKADLIAIALAVSALVLCPVAVRLSPMVPALGILTRDVYDTYAEYLVTPLQCIWLLALSASDCTAMTKSFFASSPLKFLGEISCSIYCFHAPIMYLAAWAVRNKGVNYQDDDDDDEMN